MRPRSLNFLLSLVFLFFFLLVTVLGLFSIERLSKFNRSSADVRDLWLPSTRFIGDLNNFTSDFRAAEGRNLLLSTSMESAPAKRRSGTLVKQSCWRKAATKVSAIPRRSLLNTRSSSKNG